MTPHFKDSNGVRMFVHAGEPQGRRLLDLEVQSSNELRIVLPLGSNVGAELVAALQGQQFSSAVGRILCGGAGHLSYHRMESTDKLCRPYDYGTPVVLDGYITFISGSIIIGRDTCGELLFHCHAGFIDRNGCQHGGHVLLNQLFVGSENLVIQLCLFDNVTYQLQPDGETHFTLFYPVLQEAI